MKTSLSATAIAAVFLSLAQPNQQPELLSAMQQAGVVGIKCWPGYIGVDCVLNNVDDVAKLSCFLKGKPGKSGQGVFLLNDNQNTGKFSPAANVAPASGGLRASCSLIVDIQKCMNKCVDDALA
ncbi:hypothetical protein BB561_004361 [Smittium simulii]|uniref:Killer toxin Kp4 domain-containing protein n=1 Tax=Smittium simulii TaxID=133385 RepID=A0A2T9YGP6_9FUNG|nr:hypothetical protein BB561_004361 [Smittium simulii]